MDAEQPMTMNPADLHEQVDSPHFRPAFGDLTNDSQLFPLESPGQLARKRKSLGRRVSFATKAKVRFIENDKKGDDNSETEGENLEDNIFLVTKPVLTPPDFVLTESPVKKLETNNGEVEESPKSDAVISVLSNESIEVELKDPNSSFSSYDSAEEPGDCRSYALMDDDMEITKCVGGIIDDLIMKQSAEENTMDLTTCIGGILNNISGQYVDETTTTTINPASPSSVDTMELTSVVGGIIGHLKPNHMDVISSDNPPHSPTMMVDGEEEEGQQQGLQVEKMDFTEDNDMEITIGIKDTIKTNNRIPGSIPPPTSPSPFLVKSPARFNSPLHSEISFIGDVEEPPSLAFGASPALNHTHPRIKNDQEEGGKQVVMMMTLMDRRNDTTNDEPDMDLTTELFNKYIDTNRLNSVVTFQKPTGDDDSDISPPPPKTPLQAPTNPTASQQIISPLPIESPTVTMILPRASLKDFLNETGVRFLDNLSSLNRRETTGRPRDSELVTVGKQLHVDVGLSLESDALDCACGELAKMIIQIRDELTRQEEQFNHSPPLAFLQYRDPLERSTVISKLKTLKSIARLYAKQAWYEWRQPIHSKLNSNLEGNVNVLSQRISLLTDLNEQLNEIIITLEPLTETITKETEILRERWMAMEMNDLEQGKQLEKMVSEQQVKLSGLEEEMDSLVKKEKELRQAVEEALKKRQELQTKVSTLKTQVEAVPEYSEQMLEELRSNFELLQGVTGWRFLKFSKESQLVLQYVRADFNVSFNLTVINNQTVVSLVTFDFTTMKSKLSRHALRILKVPPNLSLLQCVLFVGQRLDRLTHFDKQLAVASVQCTISIPDTLPVEMEIGTGMRTGVEMEVETSGSSSRGMGDNNVIMIPITLGFYHAATRAKFDIVLSVEGGGKDLKYSEFVSFYGVVQERHVIDAIKLSLSHKYYPIRRLVSAVHEAIEHVE